MRKTRFRHLVDSYGADPARWPAAERGPAQRLVARSPELGAELGSARRLDDLLNRFAAETPESGADAIDGLFILPAQRRSADLFRGALGALALARLWPQVATLTAASVVGVLVGLSGFGGQLAGSPPNDLAAIVFDGAPLGGFDL